MEYQQLGPEFDAIVQDYADVLVSAKHTDKHTNKQSQRSLMCL